MVSWSRSQVCIIRHVHGLHFSAFHLMRDGSLICIISDTLYLLWSWSLHCLHCPTSHLLRNRSLICIIGHRSLISIFRHSLIMESALAVSALSYTSRSALSITSFIVESVPNLYYPTFHLLWNRSLDCIILHFNYCGIGTRSALSYTPSLILELVPDLYFPTLIAESVPGLHYTTLHLLWNRSPICIIRHLTH